MRRFLDPTRAETLRVVLHTLKHGEVGQREGVERRLDETVAVDGDK